MPETKSTASDLIVRIHQQIDINAPIAVTFESILEQIGPLSDRMDGTPMPMKLEAWPGGRWFRDLGDNTGHFWGHVQVIKPPLLLELTGPMFMSFPAINHVQYKLAEHADGTRLTLTHLAMGDLPAELREGMNLGWEHVLKQIKKRSQK